jgi:ABC-type uncharacterized transport system ATPase component
VKRGDFICIIGDVGSCKSSLLHAIIGDLIYVPDSDIKQFGGFHYPIEKPEMFQKLKEKLLNPKFTVDERIAPVRISGKISYVE